MGPKDMNVMWKGEKWPCRKFDAASEAEILDTFFFWKTSVLLAEKTRTKRPQLPETFSERFTCLVTGLHYHEGSGPDAFRVNRAGRVAAAVEIKATITESGFTDIKRDLAFDELYWLDFEHYDGLKWAVYRLDRRLLRRIADASGTNRDRATVNLRPLVQRRKITPYRRGRIGVLLVG